MKNRVAIEVSGGVVECVATDQEVEILILDYDNLAEAGLQEIQDLGPTSHTPAKVGVDAVVQAYEDERAKRLAYLLEG